jgi:hypothetical protein
VVGHALVMEDERGRKKGCRGDRAPFIGDAAGVGDGLHVVPHGDKAWGGGGLGPVRLPGGAAWLVVARPRRSRAVHDWRRNRGGWGQFEYISNSNEFKVFQNLSKFD